MALTCGLVGLPSCGKTVIFNAITAARALSSNHSEINQAVVKYTDGRITKLVEMYHPRKTVPATLEIVDIPGIKEGLGGSGHTSRLLGYIKDVDALVHVVRCFEDEKLPFEYDTIDPARDVDTIDLELMVADSIPLDNKIKRLAKRVRSGDKNAVQETLDCEKIYSAIQQGIPARKQGLTPLEIEGVKECNLLSLKPVLYVANIKSVEDAVNRHVKALQQVAAGEGTEVITVCGKDEADISQLEPGEQQEFMRSLGLSESSMERLIGAAYRMLGLISFFTTGEDEVRAWTCRKSDKAPVAAGKIHTDMEKGFIRMEVIRYEDLVELGNETAVARAGKHRVESREYEVKDGDIVTVLFNVKG
ncbi:MAG: redox-regulated ATPase YchF [Dehalococcoidia bacterium]|nr:redox-regulated ATPase YchF [Dehalococcoidia bacterium]MDZ4247546.1 redox-regulated ATPase YchF [Dehalococcoidia bacterium]